MSYRYSNINVSSPARRDGGPIIVSRDIDQIIQISSTASLAPGVTNGDFWPEASVIVPQSTSVAAVSVKVFNASVVSGSISFFPYAPNGIGYYPLGPVLASGSSTPMVQRYPRGAVPLSRGDSLHLCYTTSPNYSGPSGVAGFRAALWVWE